MKTIVRGMCSLALISAFGLVLGGCPVEEGDDAGDDVDAAVVDDDDFSVLYNSAFFQTCGGCHAPDAPGFQDGVEATQNWSSRDAAYNSLQGNASGLIGNFMACNDVPLLGDTPETSLLVASLDEMVRTDFAVASHPDCDADAISDMVLGSGQQMIPADVLERLKTWISNGAPDR